MKNIDLILLNIWAQTAPTTPGGAVAFERHGRKAKNVRVARGNVKVNPLAHLPIAAHEKRERWFRKGGGNTEGFCLPSVVSGFKTLSVWRNIINKSPTAKEQKFCSISLFL